MNYAKGIDISTYQDSELTPQRIDFKKPKTLGIKFIINRATYVTSKDQDFDYNWNAEKEEGYLRTVYGFWGYWENTPDSKTQAKELVKILKPDPGEFPVIWADVEKASNKYPELPDRSISLPRLETYFKTIEDGLGITAGLYTNLAGLIRLHPIPQWMQDRPLWIAWPLAPNTGETTEAFIARTGVVPPIFDYWKKPFFLWQYSWKGPGIAAGMESYGLDMDYFNGTDEDLAKFCKKEYIPSDEEDTTEDDNYMLKMQVTVSALNVRYSPSTNGAILARLNSGEVITVYDVAGVNGSWVNISPNSNKWCCVENAYGKYLTKI